MDRGASPRSVARSNRNNFVQQQLASITLWRHTAASFPSSSNLVDRRAFVQQQSHRVDDTVQAWAASAAAPGLLARSTCAGSAEPRRVGTPFLQLLEWRRTIQAQIDSCTFLLAASSLSVPRTHATAATNRARLLSTAAPALSSKRAASAFKLATNRGVSQLPPGRRQHPHEEEAYLVASP